MSDMRADVTRAVANAVINVPGDNYDTLGPKGRAFYGTAGDAAIETVFDGLIAEVEALPDWPDSPFSWECSPFVGDKNSDIADWLRAKKAEVLGHE